MIPEEAYVGLVTFGTHVHVYELGCEAIARSYVFKGSKEYQPQMVQEALGLGAGRQLPSHPTCIVCLVRLVITLCVVGGLIHCGLGFVASGRGATHSRRRRGAASSFPLLTVNFR
jgi:hypothetical protein